ncbi:MAG: YggS family pyridoxal phosphate-dependent enzyme [Pseudomonadota bacterium]
MIRVTENLQRVREAVQNEAYLADRDADSVRLLAVSKRHPLSAIAAAYDSGQRDFGENFVDEGIAKIQRFRPNDVRWHFIGAIQSNKTRDIAAHFDWVHTVDRAKIATRLNAQRADAARALQVCLQVNIDNEPQKAGVTPEQLRELAAVVATLPRLTLRGLMCLPRQRSAAQQHEPFRQLAALLAELHDEHPDMDTLSMGMSNDMGAAIHQGATIVRVGTAIFGERPEHPPHPSPNVG